MATINLALGSLGMPAPYIRKNTNNERVNMWVEQIKTHMEELRKESPSATDADLARKAWFLPTIHVTRLAKPETFTYKDKQGKTLQTTIGHRIVDGVHRYLAALAVGLSTLEGEDHPPMTPGAAYALQFKLNHDGPLPFDRESRDAAIRQMAKFKANGKAEFTQAQIASQTGLTQTQVSRILSGKSGGLTPERLSKARGKGQKKGAKRKARAGGYSASDYFTGIRAAAREGKTHLKVLAAHMAEHDGVWDYCESLTEILEGIRQEATKIEKASA